MKEYAVTSELSREKSFWKEKCKHLELQNRGRGQSRFQENRSRERPEFRGGNKPRENYFPQSSTNQIPCEGKSGKQFQFNGTKSKSTKPGEGLTAHG